jgi:prolyl-tRNA synthetase
MLQSKLFGKTLRDAPKDEQSVNSKLLHQAGYIEKLMSGVYSYLPLGLRVIKKIENVVRQEINKLGGQEVLLPALQPKELWDVTGRWDIYAAERIMYQFADHTGRFLGLGPTHEEIVTPLAKRDVMSYRDLPFSLYQFQTKFRSELRAKSGVLRGREFLMKDLYSFHATAEDLQKYYDASIRAYQNIYERVGIGDNTVITFASGGSFSKYAHEFQAINEAGEDTIYFCSTCRIAVNSEVIVDQPSCPNCGTPKAKLQELRAIEVGNIFQLNQKFSAPFELTFKDQAGVDQPVLMGCYGLGVSRLMGAIAEIHHDDKGLTWPMAVAPYQVHLVRLGDEPDVVTAAEKLYSEMEQAGIEVLYDDRSASAGVKLKDADLIGLPIRVIVSAKTLAAGKVEWKLRAADETKHSAAIISDIQAIVKA